MQLREIVKKIRERNQWRQRDLAAELQIEQADVQRIETAGRNLEKQFSIFVRLLPLCRAIGIDPAQDLDTAELAKGIGHAAIDKTTRKVEQRGETARERGTTRRVSTGGIEGSKRKAR